MALKLTLKEIENWMRGKAEDAATRALSAERARTNSLMVKHEREYIHRKRPPKIQK